MANKKLSDKKIERMWQAFQKKQSVRYVAKICHVSKGSAQKYRVKGNWDARIDKIKKKVEAKSDSSAVKVMTDNLGILKIAKQTYASTLLGRVKAKCPKCGYTHNVLVPATKAKFGDIVALIKCETEVLEAGGGKDDKPKRVKYSLAPPAED